MNNFTKAFYTTKSKLTSVVLLAFFATMLVPELATAQPWTYDFGTGTGTHPTNTISTSFLTSTPSGGGTYRVRTGGAGGTIVLANPGTSLGTATELQLNAATSTATNKFAVYDWTSPSTVAYLKAKVRTTASATGSFGIALGVNTLGSDNNGYTGQYNNSLANFSITYASGAISSVVRRISGSNTTISSSGFAKDTDQIIEIYANNGSGSANYTRGTSFTLATRTWDLWVDGTRVVTGAATAGTLAANVNLSGFGFFAEASSANNGFMYIDDIEYSNALPSGPTVTLAQLTAGIAPSPLVASTTDKAILGFSATSSAGTPSMTAFNIGTSTTSVSKLTNVKLYTSTDNSYATAGDNTQITGFTFAQTATQLQFSVLTEALSTTAKNYFIVADIDATVTGATVAVQPSLTNANVTVSSGSVTGGTITGTNYAFDVAAGTPSISPSGTLAAVNTTYGTASGTPTSFTVSGASLTDDIVITPPAGFEISKTAIGSGYATTQTLNQSGGTVGTTTIYVRLANTTAFGTYSGNITLVSALDGLSVNVATASSTVSKKALTISGLSLVSSTKVYDATTTAAITGTAALQASIALASNTSGDGKPITGDTVSLTGTAVGDYNTKDVATATTVSYTGLSLTGASSANYSLTAHATSAATITAKPITLSGLTVPASKVYNGTTAAVVTGSPGTLATAIAPGTGTAVDGIRYTGDTANLTGTAVGTYNSANVATATTVTFTGVSLTGAQAGNYSLTAHSSQAATITKATAVITFGALAAKTTADVPFALTATSTSSNTVTYVSGTPATATISGSTVTIVAAGSTVITASDAGNANYDAAVDVPQTLTVTNGPIWSNTITGTTTSSSSNPYTTGDAVVSNLTVSGIGRGTGVTAATAADRYACTGWDSVALDVNDYFEFTLTPAPGYKIDFTNFIYTGQASGSGATAVAFRSSVDGFVGNIGIPSITGTTINLSGASYQNITTAITFRYYGWGASSGTGTFSVNDFQFNGTVALGTPVPEINVTQGGSIASGGTNAFGNQENGTSGSAVTFTIQNTGNAVLNLTGSPKVAITGNTADFVINQVSTSATVAATSGTTTFTVTFSPQAVGSRTAQLSIANDDSNENPYLINLTGTGTTSQQSTISAATFTAPTNIAYGSYQASNITSGNSLEIGKFTLQDGVSDNDSFGTTLSTITFSLSNSANIQRVALYDGATELQEITAGATNIFNAGLGAITTTDGGSKDFSIRVTFNSSVTDNQQFQFAVTAVTADAAGSGFAAANGGGATTSIAGNNNKIVVTANRLTFGTVIGSSINVTLPAFTIATTDGLGNTDLDRSAAVTLGTSSAFPSANFTRTTPTYALTGGSITISNVAFADAQTGITLTADASGLTQGVSNTFDILAVTFPANSYRTLTAGTWENSGSTSTWERFVANVWSPSTRPLLATTDFVYITKAITGSAISASNIVIENLGTLTYGTGTCSTSMLVKSGGTLQINGALNFTGASVTVESGGTFNVNYAMASGVTTLWGGTEDFQDGSTVNIQNWNYGASSGANRLIQNPSIITANTAGYYFGNLTISGAPSALFSVVEGGQTNVKICQNNFTASNTAQVVSLLNTNGASAIIGGNVVANSTGTSFAFSSATGSVTTTVNGNLSGTGTINLSTQNGQTSIVQLKGNLSIPSGATLGSAGIGSIVFSGTASTQTISIVGALSATAANATFEVGDGINASTVQLINQNLALTNATNLFTVRNKGVLDFNYFNITGSGLFTLDNFGTLQITSAAGVNKTGATGNVLSTGTRVFSQTGYYEYKGNVTPQSTGTAMDNISATASAKRIIINKDNATDVVNLTQTTGVSDYVQITQGVFVETAAANVYGGGDLTMSGGTYKTAVTSGAVPLLSGAFNLTAGTVELNAGAAQALKGAKDYANLTINLSSGTATMMNGDVTVNKVLNLTNGILVTTAPYKVISTATGSVTRTNGWVNGNLQRYVGTTTTAIPFDIGDATNYTPVALQFASPTGTGSVIVKQTNGIIPSSATSAISSTKVVNRYYTLTNSGVGSLNYAATFNFVAGDVLGGADPNNFVVGKYDGTTWTYPTVGTKTATSTQATGLTSISPSDFYIGECATLVAYNVTGGGAYCAGGSGVAVGLSNSQTGMNYQLKLDGNDVGSSVTGTGAAITFGNQTAAGVYTIVGTNACNDTATMTGSVTITVSPAIGFANLQSPASGTICQGSPFDAYGQVYIAGVTEAAGAGAGITAEFGYSTSNSDPSSWTNWFAAGYFGQGGTGNNNDEYQYTFTPPTSGTFYYTFRYQYGSCVQYGGYNSGGGGFWNGTTNVSGVLTVNPNTWNGSNGLWSVATNWSCGVVPNGATDVVIPSGTPTLNVDYTANSGTTLTINGSGSLIVNPTKTLTIAGTAAFNDRPITFESDATGTGMLGQVTGTVTGASNVTVKRFIPQGKRAFRFLTPGVTTTNFISNNWQQATHITGSTTGANGFDITVTGNPSMYTYNNQVASGTGWTAIPNTNATTLLAGTGYRMLIRGDRTPTLITAASQQNMNAAITLSATGTLKTGQVVLNALSTPAINNTSNTTTDSFSLVGNPYVSPIDWEALGKSGLVDAYYGFEPNFGTGLVRGKYVVYSTASHTNNESTSHIGRYIQSGQAFMVKNTVAGTPGTLTFNESNKASTQASVFKSANTQNLTTSNAVLRLSVYDPNELALASYPIDGTVAVFGTDFTNDLGYGDVVKLMSTGENLGLFKDSKTLAIEALAPVENNDELLVKTTQFQANKSYTFKVSTEGFASDVTAYLVDQYLNTQSAINMEAQTFATFATTTDVNSYGADRFKIVFSNTALGNDSFERKTMVIYPNPVTDNTFSISVPSNVTGAIQVTVYNLVGQEMYSTTEQAQQTLTIRPNRVLAQGVYIVQITNDGKTTNSKITIQQ